MPRLVTAPAPQRLAFIGNYLPRQCGIATFTTDLCEAVAAVRSGTSCLAIPVNDTPAGYAYPDRVRFELVEQELASYRRAADYLNINNLDLVCLQHEYGIFGGPAGSHILALLQDLRMPVVTTLHTVLREPDEPRRRVMQELAELSDRLVVMSHKAEEFLRDIYGIPAEQIDFIHHGIPDVPFIDANFYKDQFGVEGRIVLLTFGLLSPNKGIEYVIEALPLIRARFPNVVYLVVGATHPHVKRQDGESYRLQLQRLARSLGVDGHVIFHNRFVSLQELVEFIGAADVYVTPYLEEAQIVSGTLAYSFGSGKAVVSTPYWYAEELLAENRGRLVAMRDAEALAASVLDLLENETARHAMRKRAYLEGREMIWPIVAERYLASFARAVEERTHVPRPVFQAKGLDERPGELPPLDLRHLRHMTDSTGVLQHAMFSVANYSEGYCTDDNARALVVTTFLEELGEGDDIEGVLSLATRYLAFIAHAFNPANGWFRNFLSYERRWLDEAGSEDSHARALWGLGSVAGRSRRDSMRDLASQLFVRALPAALEAKAPRAWAFTLVGVQEFLRQSYGHSLSQQVREELAGRLLALYTQHSTPDWRWFEPRLTYVNAKLPHALFMCGHWMEREDMVDAGLHALRWLTEVQQGEAGHFVPIGNGWYERGGERSRFDQQPLEAQATVSACLEAHRITGDAEWMGEARRAFDWFLGRNDLQAPLYDSGTGGCRDGLHPDRPNANQGAESTLAFLMSLVEMRLAEHVIVVP